MQTEIVRGSGVLDTESVIETVVDFAQTIEKIYADIMRIESGPTQAAESGEINLKDKDETSIIKGLGVVIQKPKQLGSLGAFISLSTLIKGIVRHEDEMPLSSPPIPESFPLNASHVLRIEGLGPEDPISGNYYIGKDGRIGKTTEAHNPNRNPSDKPVLSHANFTDEVVVQDIAPGNFEAVGIVLLRISQSLARHDIAA